MEACYLSIIAMEPGNNNTWLQNQHGVTMKKEKVWRRSKKFFNAVEVHQTGVQP